MTLTEDTKKLLGPGNIIVGGKSYHDCERIACLLDKVARAAYKAGGVGYGYENFKTKIIENE